MAASPRVTVIIPTHEHATTLEFSVRSVLEQTVTDFALVIIGDGVGDDTRDVVHSIRAEDRRLSFLDRPKAPRHGEVLRHEVLLTVTSPVIAYQGDDDLLLPDHLASMLDLLADADFAHPSPILVQASGELTHLATNLSWAACRAWHLATPPRNAVSLTGVAHTLAAYRRLPHGWRTTPPGRWTDHYMWQQFLQLSELRARTSPSATTIKMAATQRELMTPGERGREVRMWWDRIHEPGFRTGWDRDVHAAVRRAATRGVLGTTHLEEQRVDLERTIERQSDTVAQMEIESADLRQRLADATQRADDAERRADEAQRTAGELLGSRSWRLTAPMRAVRRPRN